MSKQKNGLSIIARCSTVSSLRVGIAHDVHISIRYLKGESVALPSPSTAGQKRREKSRTEGPESRRCLLRSEALQLRHEQLQHLLLGQEHNLSSFSSAMTPKVCRALNVDLSSTSWELFLHNLEAPLLLAAAHGPEDGLLDAARARNVSPECSLLALHLVLWRFNLREHITSTREVHWEVETLRSFKVDTPCAARAEVLIDDIRVKSGGGCLLDSCILELEPGDLEPGIRGCSW